ncbi:dentilisin complex subunit PrcB [Treponema socranskii]|uniref:dentilisin complex subunit PrcB n=1 Tax=Treponema socranskii TaxID=53419 RepID=UPI002872A02C|nr:dentilisin complex subunit PrcB [Treponema socranskii]MDR9858147.1 dentilisin complex subunit PrcB [Treponema socranskii]
MRKHILLIVLFAFFLSACKSVPAKLQDSTTAPSVSYEAGGFVSAQSDKNAGLYPDAVSTGREGRVDVSYEILEEGNYGAEFGTAVIENQKDLDKLYARLHDRSDRPAPKIDFERKKVIAVRSGPFTTGGYGIKLYSAIDTKDGVETVFLITAPEPTQIVTQAFTTPYLIISIDVPSSKPVFVKLQRYKPEFDL